MLVTTIIVAALFGAMTSFISSAGGLFGLMHYVVNFGYTYGYETWERYGPSSFDFSSPNQAGSRAAQSGGAPFTNRFEEFGFIKDMLSPVGPCSSGDCRKRRSRKIDEYKEYLLEQSTEELVKHYNWAS